MLYLWSDFPYMGKNSFSCLPCWHYLLTLHPTDTYWQFLHSEDFCTSLRPEELSDRIRLNASGKFLHDPADCSTLIFVKLFSCLKARISSLTAMHKMQPRTSSITSKDPLPTERKCQERRKHCSFQSELHKMMHSPETDGLVLAAYHSKWV